MTEKTFGTVSRVREMAKKLLGRFPACEKWQKNFWDGFPRVRNGKKSAETKSDGLKMAKSPDDGFPKNKESRKRTISFSRFGQEECCGQEL